LNEPHHPNPESPGAASAGSSMWSRYARLAGSAAGDSAIFPYLVPLCAYVLLGWFERFVPRIGDQPDALWYFGAYTARLFATGLSAWWYRSIWKDLRPVSSAASLGLAVVLGLAVWALWIGLDGLYPPLFGSERRIGFDPTPLPPIWRGAFIVVRLVGLVVLVPLIEELFWRSCLIRWLIDVEFQKVPIGRVTWLSAGASSVFFALVHPEWLPALFTGFLWAWLLWQTKSVFACFVSHATANLALGIYIIVAGAWKFW
jgi:CAAX prenyl protease-like protein